jgi:hypothetical protein
MNITFGLLVAPELQAIRDKRRKKELLVQNALESISRFAAYLTGCREQQPAVN